MKEDKKVLLGVLLCIFGMTKARDAVSGVKGALSRHNFPLNVGYGGSFL